MNTFFLRVISSNKVFFDDKVTKLVLPLEDGEMAVLPHHENLIIATSIGEIRIDTTDGRKITAVVGWGFAQIVNNRVTMLVDSAEKPEDIDRVRAKQAMERAQERLRQQESLKEYMQTEASLSRALTRLKVSGRDL
jgi:F-type H+-transporting ATPase subunit epsilon